MSVDRLKRAFSGIEVSTNDLRTIAAYAEQSGHSVAVMANRRSIWNFDQITEIAAEDGMVDSIKLLVDARGQGRMEMDYHPGYIELIADDLAEFRKPFMAIVELLCAKSPVKGESCRIVQSPVGTWQEPRNGVRGWLEKFLKR